MCQAHFYVLEREVVDKRNKIPPLDTFALAGRELNDKQVNE